jgi:mitogen-activated protein kinase 7
MEADLNQILRSNQNLTEQHYQYFTYQLLRGLKWIHSAGVLHRDLKPGNLLVNSDCELRICDYGLARGAIDGQSELLNTEYVTTRYYRAPEVILSPTQYTKALDIWSVGCIFGEILGRKVVFKGKDHIDQLQRVFSILGTPEDALLESICSKRVLKYIQQWRRKPKTSLQKLFPHAEPSAMLLMDQLLEFNPDKRITAEEALKHPYLSQYYQPEDEPSHPKLFDFGFEKAQTIDEIKKILLENVRQHKKEKTRIKNMSAVNHPCLTGSEKMMPRYEPEEGIDGPGGIEEELMMRELKI